MIYKRSLLSSSILSIITTIILGGCNDNSSKNTIDAMAIVINASPESQSVDIGATGFDPSEKYKSDLAKGTTVDGTVLTVPAWTPAVFVMPRGNVRSQGLPVLQ